MGLLGCSVGHSSDAGVGGGSSLVFPCGATDSSTQPASNKSKQKSPEKQIGRTPSVPYTFIYKTICRVRGKLFGLPRPQVR